MSDNKKLAILQIISQRHLSGAERVCLMLSEALQKRGHRIALICKNDPAMLAEAANRNLDVRTPGISGKFNPMAAFRILNIAREVGADVIHTHLSTAALWGGVAGRIGGIPVVSHVHAMNSRYFFSLADRMLACSEGVRQHIVSQGVAEQRVTVIYNGIESKRLKSLASSSHIRTSLGISEDSPAIACIAHLANKKGQSDLLKAVALLSNTWPELICCFVGAGENLESLQRQAEELNISRQAVFLGYRTDAVDIMNTMDAVILPSLGKEGLPLVLLEAALLGKPAICSDIPGNREVVVDGVTGLLFPPGDHEELARKIDLLLSDDQQRLQMGEASYMRAQQEFTIEAMTDRVEGLYHTLVK